MKTEIKVKLLALPDDIDQSENLINAKIEELKNQGYFLNACSISEGVAVLLVGKSS